MKLKLATALLAIAVTGVGATVVAISNASRAENAGGASQRNPNVATQAPSTAPAQPAFARLGDRVTVEFLGINTVPADEDRWWNAQGVPIQVPVDPLPQSLANFQYQAAVRVAAPEGSSIAIRVSPCTMTNTHEATREGQAIPDTTSIEFLPNDGVRQVDMFVRVGSEPHETLLTCADPAAGVTAETREGQIHFAPLTENDEHRATAVFTHPLSDHDVRVRAIDTDGKELAPITERTHSDVGHHELTVVFDVPVAKIRSINFAARRLDKWVLFRNIPLDPDRSGEFKVEHGLDPTTQPGR
jgi:hypothetical protein